MGAMLTGCVECATYCHDKHLDWKYRDYDTQEPCGGPVSHSGDFSVPMALTSTIFVAIQDRNPAEVLRHLAVDANILNKNHESPVHLACRLGYMDVTKCLIDNGCPSNVITCIGSPIHGVVKAVKCGYTTDLVGLRMMSVLVRKGCPVNAVDQKGRTALHNAVTAALETLTKGLLLLGADPNMVDTDYHFTALHMAVCEGSLACVHTILEHSRVPLDARDNLNRTPVILALLNVSECVRHEPWPNLLYSDHTLGPEEPVRRARYDKMAVVEALVTAGADLNISDSYDRNAMVIVHGLLSLEMLRYGNVMGYSEPDTDVQTTEGANCHESPDDTTVNRKQTSKIQESLLVPMIRLLVMFGAQFPVSYQQTSFMQSADWMTKLHEDGLGLPSDGDQKISGPRKLVNICRLNIRQHMAKVSKLHYLDILPLPRHLLNYVHINYM